MSELFLDMQLQRTENRTFSAVQRMRWVSSTHHSHKYSVTKMMKILLPALAVLALITVPTPAFRMGSLATLKSLALQMSAREDLRNVAIVGKIL